MCWKFVHQRQFMTVHHHLEKTPCSSTFHRKKKRKNQTLQIWTITVILCKLILHGNYVRKQLTEALAVTLRQDFHLCSRLHSSKFENTSSQACPWIPWMQDPSSPAAGLETTLFTKTQLIMFYFQGLLSRIATTDCLDMLKIVHFDINNHTQACTAALWKLCPWKHQFSAEFEQIAPQIKAICWHLNIIPNTKSMNYPQKE